MWRIIIILDKRLKFVSDTFTTVELIFIRYHDLLLNKFKVNAFNYCNYYLFIDVYAPFNYLFLLGIICIYLI